MPTSSLQHTIPVEVTEGQPSAQQSTGDTYAGKVKSYVVGWRNQLRQQRLEKQTIWNECWALYRGQEDQTNKEDWQSKIVLPKAWGTVKQAVNVLMRLLQVQESPWTLEPYNQDDELETLKAEKMMDVGSLFLEKAHFIDELKTGLETGFIMGLGVWKAGWSLLPRMRMRVQTNMVSVPAPAGMQQGPLLAPPPPGPLPFGQQPGAAEADAAHQYPQQMPQENLPPQGALNGGGGQPQTIMVPQKSIVQEEILEGRLMLNAVDPYNFYWLPGSKLNRWVGTLEEIVIPKWELMKIAQLGAFGPDGEKLVEDLMPMELDQVQEQRYLRFGEFPRTATAPDSMAADIKLTEFHGPLIIDGKLVDEYRHIIVANDSTLLLDQRHDKWFRTPPYTGWSPLTLPFRTEGMGLVEMVRSIDKALNQIVNLGVDTLLFRLLPIFEYSADYYENPEDIRTGLTPGKILRRSAIAGQGQSGLVPVEFNDVSPGAMQVAGVLDRAHQEGGLVSELQQSLPRWSGAQTATETEAIQQNQNSFFGAMAADFEQGCIAPLIEMSIQLIMQYIDTANDPRVASVLGVDQAILAGMSREEVFELVQGDYQVQVRGLTAQLEKAEMLQNLVQFMNLIGQNPQAWLPWIKQDALLRKILEAFRPHIHDLERILNDPATAAAAAQSQAQQQHQGQILQMLPDLIRMKHEQDKTQLDQQQQELDNQARVADQAIALKQAAAKAEPKAAA